MALNCSIWDRMDLHKFQHGRILSHMERYVTASERMGHAIRHFLEAAGMSQTKLSNMTGIPRNSLNRKLNGGVFDYEELDKIAHALNVPLSIIVAKAEETTALADSGEEVA